MTSYPTTFFGWVRLLLDNYGPLLLRGTWVTMVIALSGTVLGFVIGLLTAIVRTVPLKDKKWYVRLPMRLATLLINIYIEVFRGTPMIVQSMVIFYGAMLIGLIGRRTPVLPVAVLIVSINTGAYMAEIVRGGIISVDKGQKEACAALGMTHWQSMVHVILPQAVRNIMPAIGNEFVVNIKDSSVLNVISVGELYFTSKSAAGKYGRYFETFFITACIYLILTFTVTRLLRLLEKHMDGRSTYTICGSQSDSRSNITVSEEEAEA